ncbi:hypothetical protein K3495_g9280 [Podosphaera aphanis]|nr:hypothetical protein K3495_g9280 [Podosphaera aphanis]
MTCQEVLRQIRNRIEPTEDLQRLKIIDNYNKVRFTASTQKIEMWLMEWEQQDIMIKRLKIADFSDYKMIQDFLSSANSLLPKIFVRKANWTSRWLKDFVDRKWPSINQPNNNAQVTTNQQTNHGIFVTSLGITSLAARLAHLLSYQILFDNGADGHACNNLALAASETVPPETPKYVKAGTGTCPIIGYGNMSFNAHLGNGETYQMTLTNVAFAPEFLKSVVSWKALKRKGIKWNSDTNAMTYNSQLICQLLDRHDHEDFTEYPVETNIKSTAMINSTKPRTSLG